jgi:LPXTG-site transpeptidase (sortase) family protein
MTLAQAALDRKMLLVAVPDAAPGVTGAGYDPGEAPRLQQVFDETGHLGQVATAGRWVTVVRFALVVVALASIGMVVQLAYVSRLEHRSAQVSLYNQFRTQLALGTAPLGPVGLHHSTLALGAPMAQITIPSIGVSQVVLEGTTGTVLADGPGHSRSTVFPGGTGDSIVLGRAAAYGGPFGRIHELRKGARITVITQVGTSVFKVVDVRPAGTEVRPVARGKSRLTLGTASGTPFVPSGVVWVDADKVGPPLPAQRPAVKTVPSSERPLGFDTGTLWALSLWVLLLAALVAGAVWTWRRRGRAQAWIVFTAPVLLVWMFVADQFARLLPNLL